MSDFPTISNVSSVGTMVMLIGYMVYKFIKHSKCRSVCCGNKTEVQIDLEPDTKKESLNK
jgi:hypothetical protein